MIVVEIGMSSSTRAFAKPRGYAFPVTGLARQIPGLSWDAAAKVYAGWPDAVAAFAHALDEEKLAAVVGELREPADDLAKGVGEWKNPPAVLRPYQCEGVAFLRALALYGGALLGDDVGLGKTAQALFTVRGLIADGVAPLVVVVCPAVVKTVWEAEAKKWLGDYFAETFVVYGTKPDRYDLATRPAARPTLFVLNYDIVHAWVPVFKTLGVVVFDECHYLLNERSRRSTAAKALASRAQARIALSATPMTARPRDLWNVVDTLEAGRLGKGPWPFLKRYADAHKETVARNTTVWITDGSSHEDELALRLRWIMLRRSKADVMADLPARVRQVIPIKVPTKNIAPVWREGWEKSRRDTLTRALTLSGSGKIPEAVELATARLAEGHSVVVFSYLRETAGRVYQGIAKATAKAKMNVEVALATGEDTSASRAATVVRLREVAKKKPVCLVATIDSVGVGIDLSFADIAIFVDLDWVPSKLLQAEGRLHRHGQTRSVTIYYLVGIGTADEYVQKKVIERLDLYERILGGAQEAKGLREDLGAFEKMNEDEVLADLRRMVIAGEVLPDEEEDAA